MVNRKEYLEQIKSVREWQTIKVVTGVRRCGKSTLFALYIDYLKSTGIADNQIVSINLEGSDYASLLEYNALYDYINARLCKDKYTYIFIDEVQNCVGFERAINSLFVKPNVDIYITGSNAYMLSGELATLLSGRYITISMLPLSFKEYCEAVPDDNSVQQSFNEYLRFGSFPYAAFLPRTDSAVMLYLDGIYNTILVKDIAKREDIGDIAVLESIAKFLADNIGSPVSAKKITDTINSAGRKISINTVDRYLSALTNSYIFYKVDRYDIKGRQHLKTLNKYYLVDSGIRSLLLSKSTADIGHIIENIVYLELLRRGYRVNIGKVADKEVDFIATNMSETVYFQVSASVLDSTTLARELEPLQKISDNHPKFLLTLDEIGAGANHNGIRQINLLSWLLS
ncbi:MAG: ATP-binding protein [Deferribacteraceae bacterium]|jgi:predicted AAA+ superfamily ATPase|nr:ATP-binding protein [Deferribacteraceae bacterium]